MRQTLPSDPNKLVEWVMDADVWGQSVWELAALTFAETPVEVKRVVKAKRAWHGGFGVT